jgi:hypothetical protein
MMVCFQTAPVTKIRHYVISRPRAWDSPQLSELTVAGMQAVIFKFKQ